MSDRETELRDLAAEAREYDAVEDAFIAKSFTDQLVVVDLHADVDDVPEDLISLFEAHDCYGANRVYDRESDDRSSVGGVGDVTRHQFVDVETRGEHQSYVVDS